MSPEKLSVSSAEINAEQFIKPEVKGLIDARVKARIEGGASRPEAVLVELMENVEGV